MQETKIHLFVNENNKGYAKLNNNQLRVTFLNHGLMPLDKEYQKGELQQALNELLINKNDKILIVASNNKELNRIKEDVSDFRVNNEDVLLLWTNKQKEKPQLFDNKQMIVSVQQIESDDSTGGWNDLRELAKEPDIKKSWINKLNFIK